MGPLPTKAQIKPIVKPAHKIIPVINHKFHRVPTYPVINHRPRMLHGKSNQQFYVEPGSGEIREIHEYALAHNYKAPIYRAQSIYSRLLKTYGSNIIKLKGNGPSTYTISPGDIGLAHPGYAHWYPGVEASLRRLLSR